MFSISLYYNILTLEASNNNLLDLYSRLYRRAGKEDEEEEYRKTILRERMELRKEIQQELAACLHTEFKNKRSSFITITCSYTLPFTAQLKYGLDKLISSPSWEKCREYEMENVTRYYNVLYDQQTSKPVTDLLLSQKSRVEGYLIG